MRDNYKNGEELILKECGCNSCNPMMINGHLCHEIGCPDAWKDEKHECKWCGTPFVPEQKGQKVCSEDCGEAYFG